MVSTKILFSLITMTKYFICLIFFVKGNTLLVTGNSGKGKTTYLHILAGLLKA